MLTLLPSCSKKVIRLCHGGNDLINCARCLSLLGVTIGILLYHSSAWPPLTPSIEKSKTDLSSLDKNTIYLTSQSFGPSDVPRWKREQFPNVTFEEYQYLKGC